jgi:hypothetical protein
MGSRRGRGGVAGDVRGEFGAVSRRASAGKSVSPGRVDDDAAGGRTRGGRETSIALAAGRNDSSAAAGTATLDAAGVGVAAKAGAVGGGSAIAVAGAAKRRGATTVDAASPVGVATPLLRCCWAQNTATPRPRAPMTSAMMTRGVRLALLLGSAYAIFVADSAADDGKTESVGIGASVAGPDVRAKPAASGRSASIGGESSLGARASSCVARTGVSVPGTVE